MKNIWNWIKGNPNRTMFLIPILLVAGISISHVVSWYNIANPLNWAIYLSIAIEVGAMTALVAATNRIKGGVWFMFGLVTIIQMIGNIFYSFKEIDENGDLFKSWVELTGPFWDMFTDSTDITSMKRWLAFLEGGLLPIISLTSLHFFVKYEKTEEKKPQETEEDTLPISEKAESKTYKKEEDWKERLAKEPINPSPPPTGEVFYTDLENLPTKEEQGVEFESENEFNSIDNDEDNHYPLVEEENPEDEIILPPKEKPKVDPKTGQIDLKYDATKLVEGEDYHSPRPPITPGEELNRSWKNIINFRRKKGNNGIERI